MLPRDQMSILLTSPLFRGIAPEGVEELLRCIGTTVQSYGRQALIFSAGETARMGLVISGEVRILTEDLEGRQNVMARLVSPELFGEVFALSGRQSSVTAYTETGADVLFLRAENIVSVCSRSCDFHRIFLWNLLHRVAEKNVLLNRKIYCVGQRSTREKIIAFLSVYQQESGKTQFRVPMSRAEMADYLCVDRSALSAVLSQMHKEGLLSYERDNFILHTNTALQ